MVKIDEQENFCVDIPDVPAMDTSEGSYKNVATFHSYAKLSRSRRSPLARMKKGGSPLSAAHQSRTKAIA